ncbi:transcriptional regulator [Halogranum amylolyticum]|uniref:Transcriptional regulator n=1 Tax=Halogranum amylolyticum TaxID=660520 RepID=A0A1H8SGP1_9EURY|nr:TrmB family transcriptional regulator [Halogranum amylolyticum]SEO77363.1 transcriptional regulator [Halogranum amylolyticum]
MDSAELRGALEDAGLSQYQAEAYNTLLQLGSASATELADACAVPTARIYDVLRDLESKDYIETYDQDSLHARARNPEDVLADLRGRAEMLVDAADEIEERWEQPEVDRHKVSIVKRFDTVFDRAAATIRDAEYEVQLSVTVAQFRELRPALQAAVDNGAIVKISIHTPPTERQELPPQSAFEDVATEVRHRELPTPFVALVDRTETCFAPHAGSLNQYGVLVDDYTLTYVFHWYFQTCLWEVWDVVYDGRPDDPPMSYADIRRCVRDIEPLLEAGVGLTVTVEGFATDTGESVSISGTVVDLLYEGMGSTEGSPPLSQLAGQVAISVETDRDVLTVGGWGSVLEEVEATRITIEAIEENSHVLER